MKFKDLIKEYGKNFTVAYVTIYDDELFHMYVRVYPSRIKNVFLCALRIDSQDTHEHIVFSDKEMIIPLDSLANKEVEDYH